MSSTSSGEARHVDADLWRYIDRELPARRLAEVSEHLRSCAACRRLYEERLREGRLIGLALPPERFGEGLAERVSRDLVAEAPPARPRRAARSRRPGWRQRLAVAALLVLSPLAVFVGLRLAMPEVRELGRFHMAAGPGEGEAWALLRLEGGRSARPVSGVESFPLRPGSRFEVRPGGTLVLELGAGEREAGRLEVVGPAVFGVASEATLRDFRGRLDAGAVRAEVRPRGAGEPFVIGTPDAEARVVGTVFRLEVFDGESRLTVEEGEVALAARGATGESGARARAGEVWRVPNRPGAPAEAIDPATPPARPGPQGARRRAADVFAEREGAATGSAPGIGVEASPPKTGGGPDSVPGPPAEEAGAEEAGAEPAASGPEESPGDDRPPPRLDQPVGASPKRETPPEGR